MRAPIALCGMLLALLPATPTRAAGAAAGADPDGIIVPPVVFRVGAFGAPCTHATLPAAIAAASTSGTTEIRLADNQVYNAVNVNIVAKNVTIVGGYVDCAAAAPSDGARTSLIGAPGADDSVIEVVGGESERSILLRNLELEGGEPDADGGGGLEVDGSAVVTLDNVLIAGNASTDGGGVHLSGATNPVELRVAGAASFVGSPGNTASDDGGGIYCEQASIRVDASLDVAGNVAEGAGGGFYLDDCDLVVGALGADTVNLEVVVNEALNGGGLWAGNGSLVSWRGERHLFVSNRATQSGGGMAVSGVLTSAFVDSAHFLGNSVVNDLGFLGASAYGGAVHVGGGALADFDGGVPQPCQPPRQQARACVWFSANRAETLAALGSAHGGAIYVGNGEVRARQARFSANEAETGSAVWASGPATIARFESVIAEANSPGQHAFEFLGGVDATLAYATLVDASDDEAIRVTGAGTALGLHASVIYGGPVAGVEFDGSATIVVSCLLGAPGSAVPTIDNVFNTDFVDTDTSDYRPSASSRLIDRCTDVPYAPTSRDAIGVLRPVDDPDQADDPGVYDVGAYERLPDLLFADSYETAP